MELEHVLGNTWVFKSWELIPFYKVDESHCILLDTGLNDQREDLEESPPAGRPHPRGGDLQPRPHRPHGQRGLPQGEVRHPAGHVPGGGRHQMSYLGPEHHQLPHVPGGRGGLAPPSTAPPVWPTGSSCPPRTASPSAGRPLTSSTPRGHTVDHICTPHPGQRPLPGGRHDDRAHPPPLQVPLRLLRQGLSGLHAEDAHRAGGEIHRGPLWHLRRDPPPGGHGGPVLCRADGGTCWTSSRAPPPPPRWPPTSAGGTRSTRGDLRNLSYFASSSLSYINYLRGLGYLEAYIEDNQIFYRRTPASYERKEQKREAVLPKTGQFR